MVVGNRRESVEVRRERHIEEAKQQIIGWEEEIKRAQKDNDVKLEQYCIFWMDVWKNTLDGLINYEIS